MLKVLNWIDYDSFNFKTAEGTEEEIKAVAANIRENGYKFGGDDHENHIDCCPLLSNGKAVRLSWRNWGYVMALAYNLKTDTGEYNYILWYMGEYGPSERVFPEISFVNLNSFPRGKDFDYELTKEEYDAINDPYFDSFVMPVDYIQKNDLYTFDVIKFKYNGKIVLESMINECRFSYFDIDEILEKNEIESYPAENTNFKLFDKTKLSEFIKNKYKIDNDKLVIFHLDHIDDKRDELLFLK